MGSRQAAIGVPENTRISYEKLRDSEEDNSIAARSIARARGTFSLADSGRRQRSIAERLA